MKWFYKRMIMLVSAPLSILILYIGKKNSWIAEYVFARNISYYPAQVISTITGSIPISIAEVFLICSPFILVVAAALFIRNFYKNPSRRKDILYKAVVDIICVASVMFFLFAIFDGIYYYRYDFSYYAGLKEEKSTKEELFMVGTDLIKQANELREGLNNEDNNGVFALKHDYRTLARNGRTAYKKLAKHYPVFKGHYGLSKELLSSKYVSYTEIVGIYVPFTLETHNDTDIVDYNIPSDMCHELAHLHGFIREDEANFIGYLACIYSGDREFMYSGILQAYIAVENALYSTDKDMTLEMSSKISEKVLRDMTANSEYWNRIESSKIGNDVSQKAEKINDTYIKANGEEEGVKSYGLMVNLLVSQYKKDGYFNEYDRNGEKE